MFSGNDLAKDLQTYQATLGYNLALGKTFFMPTVRYNYLQKDANTDGKIAETEKETNIWAGLNWYIDKNNLKVQTFYKIHQDKAATGGTDKKDNEFYIQLQTAFGKTI